MNDTHLLIGDIGGTNARFAIARPGQSGYEQEQVLLCDDFESAELAIQYYLRGVDSPAPHAICLAVAGPVSNGTASLTNNQWDFNESHMAASLSCERVKLLNDFEAIALSLAELESSELSLINCERAPDVQQKEFVLAVVGPGTGLGAASLIKREGSLYPMSCEAGHVGFAPETELQRVVLLELSNQFGRVSDERLVSGTGLSNIYSAMANIRGADSKELDAATIFAARDVDPIAQESVDLFFEVLGQVSGNFVLATGAFDGLFIGGGIVQRYPDLLKDSGFRAGFENKGRHSALMREVPTALVNHSYPGLLGTSSLAKSWFANSS